MLEIRNVTRIYKPKKGVPVKALDNVSLKFPEKGMVFILGKSGSGKSTLLNILGGLDRADKGEIIIKGKSSKDFTQSDFDSYRNTYLGFVFQEYNILNEFTVGANIGLALELQGKKATNQEINRILEEVDLVGYGNRKPTELSGGQKQRVAIARALVKNPEIILADEPTGALDSKTGIQVFETLKKLSKDKLVIVVTHDREYAEYYGDRVIEFKDGRVISDIEKYIAPSLKKNPNLSIVDDKIITIKKGYQLTAEDVRIINEYIKEHNAIISIDDRANEDLRKFARIDEEGNKEAFKETDESKIKISEDKKFRLIKSRLPWKNSVRIGASGLKSKPFRLVLTIILSVVAFTMAGLTDTLGSYNKYAATTKSFIDSKLDSYILQKQIEEYDENYDYYYTTDLYSNDDDIQLLKEKTGLNFKGVYRPANSYYLIDFENYAIDRTKASNLYYLRYGDTGDFSGFYEIDEAELNSLGFAYYGELPDEYDEIAISEYFYRYYKTCGYSYNDKHIPAQNINSVQDFLNINPVFVYNGKAYKITAVIDTKFDYERFKSLEDFDENPNDMRFDIYFKLKELSSTVAYGYHGIIFTKKGFINKLMNKNFDFLELSNFSIMMQIDENYSGFEFYSVTKNSFIPEENKVYFSNISKLGPNDIILPAYAYDNYIKFYMRNYYEKRYGSDDKYLEEMPDWYDDLTLDFDRYLLEEFIPQNYPQDFYVQEPISATYNDGENVEYLSYKAYTPDEMAELDENEKHKIYFTYLKSQYYNEWDKYTYNYLRDVYKYYSLTKALKDETKLNEFLNFVNPKNAHAAIGLVRSDRIYLQNDYNIVGVYCPSDFYQYYYDLRGIGDGLPLIINDDFYNELALKYNGYYYYLIAPMPSSESEISRLVKFGYDNSFENGVSYQMRNNVMSIMRDVNNLIENLAKVFLYIGIGFAVFSALLLMNFITISISYKSKEIGILRAIGARSSDVFGIFFNESMIIALINYALSIIATVLGVFWINSLLRNEYKLLITLLVFGIRQIVLMLAISVGVAFIASFFPVMRVARKKPVEAMKK